MVTKNQKSEIAEFYTKMKGDLSWPALYKATGIGQYHIWRALNWGSPLPATMVKYLYSRGGGELSEGQILAMLLGTDVYAYLNLGEISRLTEGRMTITEWIKSRGSLRQTTANLGIDKSTVFHFNKRIFKKFRPARAVEVVRRSSYEIDLFSLIGAKREWFYPLFSGRNNQLMKNAG